jgi:hypothetical protein
MARSTTRLALLVSALSAGACGYGSDRRQHDPPPQDDCGSALYEATIDTDVGLETDLGRGVGAFIEYGQGGLWRLFTTCDTLLSGYTCLWDIIVSPFAAGAIFASTPEGLEGLDLLAWEGSDNLRLIAYTGSDSDGLTFAAEPGVGMRVDALVDGGCANRYLFWHGDGARHEGAPSNPIDLIPSSP